LRKSLVDNIEEALIQLQYAVADYYSCSASDRPRRFSTLDAALCELRKGVSSTHLAINLLPQTRLVFENSILPEALAKRLRVAGCIYTTMRSQVALGGVTDLVGDLWVEFSAGAAFPSALGP
jgi:hypothetical protein